MNHYTIPNTDLRVSRLAYGTWHMGGTWDKTPPTDDLKARAHRLISTAVDCGINHIDLADIYTLGKSDEVVGYALRQDTTLRDKLVLQEKCGIIIAGDPEYGPPGRYDFSADHIIKTVERSLKRLGTDRVEILTLHRPDLLVEYEEVARALDELHESGKVLHIGVSNHTDVQIQLLQRYIRQPIVLNQVQLSLLHHHLISDGVLANMNGYGSVNAPGLLDFCRLHDIMIQAWSPAAGGRVFGTAADATEVERGLAQQLTALAKAHETTSDAIALAWLLRHPCGIQPIVGSLKEERIRDSVPADDVKLSRKEWYGLLEAARGEAVP
jgi:predicted oxidoreductase